jgi:hypothetical protein
MRLWRFILVACFFCGFASAGVAAESTPQKASRQDATTRRESKRLRKTFGLVLPDSAKVTTLLKTPRTKATYLLIKMSSDDGLLFKKGLMGGPTPGHPKISASVEDADCVEKDGMRCTHIGYVNMPSDMPDDIIDKWYEDNNFKSDTIASYRTDGFKKFASMFLDSKKGLLVLWYKA